MRMAIGSENNLRLDDYYRAGSSPAHHTNNAAQRAGGVKGMAANEGMRQ